MHPPSLPLTLILISTGKINFTISLFLVHYVCTGIKLPVKVSGCPRPMHLVVEPLPFVRFPIRPCTHPHALHLVVDEVAFIVVAVGSVEFSLSVSEPVMELAMVVTLVRPGLRADPELLILNQLPLISTPRGLDLAAAASSTIVFEIAYVKAPVIPEQNPSPMPEFLCVVLPDV
jgi:hypothetical protein